MLSVIVPSYNEETMIQKTTDAVSTVLTEAGIPWELVFVDDGSSDATWQEIGRISERQAQVRGIRFSRNFGKESAILAGLANAAGDCCAVMDCDLQHPPEVLVTMYRLWEEGYEVVEGVKRSRGRESPLHRASARLFYRLISKAVKVDMSRASDFKLLDRKAVDALLSMPERNAFFRALSSWVGYRSISVEFDVREREDGDSKWSSWSLLKYALTNIVAFSTVPMQFVTIAGACMFLLGLVLGCETLVRYFRGHAVEGFTTVILLILLTGSVIMISLGIIGYYIARIYEEVKGRPKYLISKKTGGERVRTDQKTAEASAGDPKPGGKAKEERAQDSGAGG